MLFWLVAIASSWAQQPREPLVTVEGAEEVRHAVIAFDLARCDGVRARYHETRSPEEAATTELRIELHNRTGETCWYQGVALKGTLAGTYTPRPLPPEGLGIMAPADQPLVLDLHPEAGRLYRPVIELQIAPGRGLILLKADPVEDPAPEEPAPAEVRPADP